MRSQIPQTFFVCEQEPGNKSLMEYLYLLKIRSIHRDYARLKSMCIDEKHVLNHPLEMGFLHPLSLQKKHHKNLLLLFLRQYNYPIVSILFVKLQLGYYLILSCSQQHHGNSVCFDHDLQSFVIFPQEDHHLCKLLHHRHNNLSFLKEKMMCNRYRQLFLF